MKIEKNFIDSCTLNEFAQKYDLTLVVGRRNNDCMQRYRAKNYHVSFKNSWISKSGRLSGVFGDGDTIDEAINDYASKISGFTLVINAHRDGERYIEIPYFNP